MTAIRERLQERAREVGQLLREARIQKGTSATKCAELLQTSRRRYAAIEEGEVSIEFPELELLASFLGIPQHKLWLTETAPSDVQHFTVQATHGKVIRIEIVPPVEMM